jgi:sec-independent protein translocase protein TatB
MFDIGFSEIMVVAVVALVVLGPEKLPKTARTLGHLFGRLQRYVADVKADINRELQLDELRKLQGQVQTAAKDLETSMVAATQQVQSGLRGVESELNAAATGAAADAAPAMTPPAASLAAPPAPPEAPRTESAERPVQEAPRQESLPGFERN